MKIINQVEEFFYFDEKNVSRLYNQIESKNPDSSTTESGFTREYSGSIRPEIDSGILWTKLLAGMKIASEMIHKRSITTKKLEMRTTSDEQRYLFLHDHLLKTTEMRRGLRDGWRNALARGGGSYCIFEEKFYPEAVPSGDWVVGANERKTLILTDANRQYRMGMGFANLTDVRNDNLRPSSHTAIRIRNGAKIRVFGKIDESRYIKPYVASWI